jgi:hypothetical protein
MLSGFTIDFLKTGNCPKSASTDQLAGASSGFGRGGLRGGDLGFGLASFVVMFSIP